MAPADRRARRSRRGLGDRGCRRRPGIGADAGGRRPTHRGRRPVASLPPSAHPFGDPAASDGRGTAACAHRAGGRRGRLRSGGLASRGRDRRARRVGGRAPRRRRRTGDPAGRAQRRGRGAPAGGHPERGRPRAWDAAPARRRRRERDRPDGRHRPDARRSGADRRPGARGSTPGLDHRPLAQRAAVTARKGEPPVRRRRRETSRRGRRGATWVWRCSSSLPPGAGGWTPASRSVADRRCRPPACGPGPTPASSVHERDRARGRHR